MSVPFGPLSKVLIPTAYNPEPVVPTPIVAKPRVDTPVTVRSLAVKMPTSASVIEANPISASDIVANPTNTPSVTVKNPMVAIPVILASTAVTTPVTFRSVPIPLLKVKSLNVVKPETFNSIKDAPTP